MSVEYKQLKSIGHFKECAELQRKIFNLSDLQIIPPELLRVFARPHHPLGITIGCFKKSDKEEELIGFTTGISDFQKESMYVLIIGILPEYQNKMYGIHLSLAIKDAAYENGFKYVFSSFDPLEIKIARVYLGYGMYGVKYIENEYEINENLVKTKHIVPTDKIFLRWDIESSRVKDKINKTYKNYKLEEAIEKFPLVKNTDLRDDRILIEIPENFNLLKKENFNQALKNRTNIRKLLKEYINNKGYTLTECITGRINKNRKTYYLLEKIASN